MEFTFGLSAELRRGRDGTIALRLSRNADIKFALASRAIQIQGRQLFRTRTRVSIFIGAILLNYLRVIYVIIIYVSKICSFQNSVDWIGLNLLCGLKMLLRAFITTLTNAPRRIFPLNAAVERHLVTF